MNQNYNSVCKMLANVQFIVYIKLKLLIQYKYSTAKHTGTELYTGTIIINIIIIYYLNPVSYTHLDVYKRQHYNDFINSYGES